jgi:hypothetical protein
MLVIDEIYLLIEDSAVLHICISFTYSNLLSILLYGVNNSPHCHMTKTTQTIKCVLVVNL